MDRAEQTVVVTGAGGGIGRAIAVAFADRGYDVGLADIDADGVDRTKRLVERRGQSGLALRTDLRVPADVADSAERALDAFGSVEALVNNAGVAGPTLACEDVPVQEWDETIAVNLRGAFLMTRELLPTMRERGYGRIVNVASVTGKRPVPNRTPYAASKMGLIGFTRSLAAEVGRHDINVNVVCPGSVQGPRIERVFERHAAAEGTTPEAVERSETAESARNELVRPESVAEVAAFLCSADADQMTGQDINVSAGKVMY